MDPVKKQLLLDKNDLQPEKKEKMKIEERQQFGVATVCNQGANNRLAIKLLLQETNATYLRRGEEPRENIILINNRYKGVRLIPKLTVSKNKMKVKFATQIFSRTVATNMGYLAEGIRA
ncbi:unnamed protein product, partial [Iphiclides podalirius]